MPLPETLNKAANEIEQGKLWRAREILCSSVQSYGYQKELFRSIADLMLQMGDTPEAGKYYLLSVDEPNDTELDAIDCFLQRYQKSDVQNLIGMFPPQCRSLELGQCPTYLQNHLKQMGATDPLQLKAKPSPSESNLTGYLLWAGCMTLIFAFIACAILGFATVVALITGIAK